MVGEALGGQLQREHVAINPGAEVAPEDEGWNGDDEAKGRVVERHRNAVRQLGRVAARKRAGRRLREDDFYVCFEYCRWILFQDIE